MYLYKRTVSTVLRHFIVGQIDKSHRSVDPVVQYVIRHSVRLEPVQEKLIQVCKHEIIQMEQLALGK